MSTRPLRALVRKDLRIFLSDRRAVIISMAVPVALASLMAVVMGGMGGGRDAGFRLAVRVADQDQSKLSQKIVDGLKSDKNLDVTITGLDPARDAVRAGKAVVALAIPKGFGSAAAKSFFGPEQKPELLFLYDPTHNAELGMLRGILTQHVMQAVSAEIFSVAGDSPYLKEAEFDIENASGLPPALKDSLRTMFRDISRVRDQVDKANDKAKEKPDASPLEVGGMRVPYDTREESVTAGHQAERAAMYAHAFAGMLVQFILFGAIEAGVGILSERQRGLWKRLRAAPLSRRVMLAARTISGAIFALLSTVVVFGFGMVVFGIRIGGSPLGFALIAIAYALTASSFGLLIAALGKTPQAARGVSILAVLIMVLLGGAWMPTFIFPRWLQQITPVIPTRWAVDGFEAMTFRGLGLASALPTAAALVGFALLFGALAIFRFRWEAD